MTLGDRVRRLSRNGKARRKRRAFHLFTHVSGALHLLPTCRAMEQNHRHPNRAGYEEKMIPGAILRSGPSYSRRAPSPRNGSLPISAHPLDRLKAMIFSEAIRSSRTLFGTASKVLSLYWTKIAIAPIPPLNFNNWQTLVKYNLLTLQSR